MAGTLRVRVLPGVQVYLGGHSHPFVPGDEFELDEEHARAKADAGHVQLVASDAAPEHREA